MTRPVTVTDRTGLAQVLRHLKLSGMLQTLDARLAQASGGDLGHLDFLQVLCEDEISRRESVSLAKRLRRAPGFSVRVVRIRQCGGACPAQSL